MFDKTKQHFRDNKNTYLACGVTAVIVGGITYYLTGKSSLISPKITQVLSYKPMATMEVYIEALGDPGNIIQDLTTGTVYASQNQAANALGVNRARISEHLSGQLDSVGGHKFQFLGKASVPQ